MRKIISGLFALSGLGSLMLQVDPHDAGTNFCNWLLPIWKTCTRTLPGWFDDWAWVFPIGLFCAAAGLFIWPIIIGIAKRLFVGPVESWKDVPAKESNLAAYIRSSALVQRLDDEISKTEKLPIKADETTAFFNQENIVFFGISDIAKLDALLKENQAAILRMASYSFTESHILRGASVTCLFDVLGAQLGEVRLRQINALRQFSHITESGIKNRINAYCEFRKTHSVRARVPLVTDFNLVPIEKALPIAREQCSNSVFASSIKIGTLPEQELLAYVKCLNEKMVFYGTLRGQNVRMPFGRWSPDQFPAPMLRTPITNPRFEHGKIVVDSQLLGNDSRGELAARHVTYECIFVLRPDLMRVIDQLKRAKK